MNIEPRQYFIIEESTDSFSSWLARPYISDQLKKQLAKANVLILPTEGFRDKPEPLFPEGTEGLFSYFQDNKNESLHIDILVEDEEYKEYALHYDLVNIGVFLVVNIITPIFTGLLTNYIQNKLGSKVNKSDITVELIVVDNMKMKATRLQYQGPAVEFEEKIMPIVQSLVRKDVEVQEDESTSNQERTDGS